MDSPHKGLAPIIVEHAQDAVTTNDQMSHISTILVTEELAEDQK